MDIVKATRVGGLIGRVEEAAESARRQRIDGWIRALKATEAAAKARELPVRLYQANYRVESEDSDAKGTESQRRSALVELLHSLAPKERHRSTSTWIFQLHIADAADIANLLAAPLDIAIDFLAVAELNANRTRVGNARLRD